MTRLTMAGMVLMLLARADAPSGKDAKQELEKLQGSWLITAGSYNGEERAVGGKFIVQGSAYKVFTKEGKEAALLGSLGKFTIDPEKRPRHINITFEDFGQDVTFKGIYDLEGDGLKICAHIDDRPVNYESKAGSFRQALILKRAK